MVAPTESDMMTARLNDEADQTTASWDPSIGAWTCGQVIFDVTTQSWVSRPVAMATIAQHALPAAASHRTTRQLVTVLVVLLVAGSLSGIGGGMWLHAKAGASPVTSESPVLPSATATSNANTSSTPADKPATTPVAPSSVPRPDAQNCMSHSFVGQCGQTATPVTPDGPRRPGDSRTELDTPCDTAAAAKAPEAGSFALALCSDASPRRYGPTGASVKMLDASGAVIYENSSVPGNVFSLSGIPAGDYTLQVTLPGDWQVVRNEFGSTGAVVKIPIRCCTNAPMTFTLFVREAAGGSVG